ncbi:MAG: hypothetical protein ACK5P7_07180 [Bdellovibrio sp.]|jgi:hypothetical protein
MLHLRITILALVFAALGCASLPDNPQLQLISVGEYQSIINKNTEGAKSYDGFMNTMDFKATLLSSAVVRAQADQNARVYQWDPAQYAKEKETSEANLQKESQMFLSFFIPERKYDDLAKPTTRWKIFLDANGRRFEGKAARIKAQLAELMVLYPHHTRWQTAYKVTFPIPMSLIEKSEKKLTLTGPVGSSSIVFKSVE